MESWRRAGGEPDVATELPSLLAASGFTVIEARPLIYCVAPTDERWHWLAAFVASGLDRLVELEMSTAPWAAELRRWFAAVEASGAALMLTPTVLEIIASRQ
jgi:hypothetical protein